MTTVDSGARDSTGPLPPAFSELFRKSVYNLSKDSLTLLPALRLEEVLSVA